MPYRERLPTELAEGFRIASVACPVGFELRGPVVEAGLWSTPFGTAVPVPETSVNENRFVAAGENDVRFAGQDRRMEAKAKLQSS